MVADCHGGGGGGGGGDFLIKLFGKTIPVPEPDSDDAKDLQQSSSSSSSSEQDQDAHALDNTHQDTSDLSPQPEPEVVDAEDPNKTSPPQTTAHQKPGNGGGGDGEAARQREKLRKPDKVLPCPRCSSMDTKFCYFNNYNVNQPRHFCKNCQRYWTAGGAMRNVPVGAGRRKNKNAAAASHFFQRVRDALPAAAYGSYGAGGDTLVKTTAASCGTVLSFGGHGGAGGAPACLDLAEQLSGHLAPPPVRRNSAASCSEGSISTNRDEGHNKSSSVDDEAAAAAAANADGSSVPQQHPPTASINVWPPPPPAYFSSGIAIPIYPAAPAYWGCMVPGAWSLPWPVQQPPLPSSSSPPTTTGAGAADSSSDSHTLRKRPRGGRDGDDDDNDGRNAGHGNKLWAPKTIRIDDVDEVARSSIWSLIGIKGDKTKQQQVDAKPQLGMVFEPKREGEATKNKKAMMVTSSSPSPFLHANPVALTRSVAFQEGS